MRRVGLTLVAAAALGVPSAASAPERDARIRVGIGIGKVEIGMTLTQVKRVLGPPKRLEDRQEIGFGRRYLSLAWGRSEHLFVGFLGPTGNERVVQVWTFEQGERTAEGIGVGTRMPKVRSALRRFSPRCVWLTPSDFDKREGGQGRGNPYEVTGPKWLYYCDVVGRRTTTHFEGRVACSGPVYHPQPCDIPKVRIVVGAVLVERLGLRLPYSVGPEWRR